MSCTAMLNAAHDQLLDGGHVVIGTGRSILVPFKKPLGYYLSTNPTDTHFSRFFVNPLTGMMAKTSFREVHVNRCIDTEYMVVIVEKRPCGETIEWQATTSVRYFTSSSGSTHNSCGISETTAIGNIVLFLTNQAEKTEEVGMDVCSCNNYVNSYIFDLNQLLRSVHGLVRRVIKDRYAGSPVRVAVFGAGTPGWLALSVLREYNELQPVLILDNAAEKLSDMDRELRMFRSPSLPIMSPESCSSAEVDVVLVAANPSAHEAIIGFLDSSIPGVPRYFINHDETMKCIHLRTKPVLLVTTGRCGTLWLWEMSRYASFYNGFSEVIPVNADNEFDYDVPGRMVPGQYTVGHHRLTPGIRDLVERGQVVSAFLYRDPRDVAVSQHFYGQRKNKTVQTRFQFDVARYQEVVDHIREWTRQPETWTFRFEDLKVDTVGVFRQFCAFVGWDLEEGLAQRIVEAHTFQKMAGRHEGQEDKRSHYRKGISGDWANHFDDKARRQAKDISGELLIELGYETGMDW